MATAIARRIDDADVSGIVDARADIRRSVVALRQKSCAACEQYSGDRSNKNLMASCLHDPCPPSTGYQNSHFRSRGQIVQVPCPAWLSKLASESQSAWDCERHERMSRI